MSEKKQTFEEALRKLEQSSEKLRDQETTLEEAIANYEKGLEAYRECREILDKAEQKVETLIKEEE